MTTVGVIGLGKLGLPLALVLAEAGHRVFAWDVDESVRKAVQTRSSHIDEPLITDMLRNLSVHLAEPDFIGDVADVILLVVPTPSKPDGSFDDRYVRESIGALHTKRTDQAISLVSTVSPGTCAGLRMIARARGFEFVYTPTMIALGSVVHDLQQAEVQIFGWQDTYEGAAAAALARFVWRDIAPAAPLINMSLESAEIAKLASNAFSTLKISFANCLGQWCDQYLGSDVDDVVTALSYRSHIGPKLITPGAGFGGPCLPRDTHAVAAAGLEIGDYVHQLNEEHIGYVTGRAIGHYVNTHDGERVKTFAVLGREYKDGANHRIESFGDKLHHRLIDSYKLTPIHAREADLVVIAMPLRGLNLCTEIKPGAVVYDLWRTHPYLDQCPVTYLALGVPS